MNAISQPSPSSAVAATDVPLVVDLDGTFTRDDTFILAILASIRCAPWRLARELFCLPARGWGGWAAFKARVFALGAPAPEMLHQDPELLKWLRSERARGRELWLVTASPEAYAKRVARAAGIFAGVAGSTDQENLKGLAKARWLANRFGPRRFDYIGDSPADLPVWQAAREAIGAGSPGRLATLREQVGFARTFPVSRPPAMAAWWRSLRPHQCSKNLLVGVPLVTAHRLADPTAWIQAIAAASFLCAAASAVYLVNDLLDLEADRAHPRKRRRPIAAGELPLAAVVVTAVLMASLALAGATAVSPRLGAVLATYAATSLSYSFFFKRKLIADVVALAGLYLLRIIAGVVAIGVELSLWLLTFAGFLMASLALAKRASELYPRRLDPGITPGRGYLGTDSTAVQTLGIGCALISLLVFALYVGSPAVTSLYARPARLWLALPFLFYWTAHLWVLVGRGYDIEDPIVFAFRSRVTYLAGGGIVAAFVGAAL